MPLIYTTNSLFIVLNISEWFTGVLTVIVFFVILIIIVCIIKYNIKKVHKVEEHEIVRDLAK